MNNPIKRSLLASIIMGSVALTGCGGGSDGGGPPAATSEPSQQSSNDTNNTDTIPTTKQYPFNEVTNYEFMLVKPSLSATSKDIYRHKYQGHAMATKMISNVYDTEALPVVLGENSHSGRYSVAFSEAGLYTLDRITGDVTKVSSDTTLATKCAHEVVPGTKPLLSVTLRGADNKCDTSDDVFKLYSPLDRTSRLLSAGISSALAAPDGTVTLLVGIDANKKPVIMDASGKVVFTGDKIKSFVEVHWLNPANTTLNDEVILQVDSQFYRLAATDLLVSGIPSTATFNLPEGYYNGGYYGYAASGDIYIEGQKSVYRYNTLSGVLTKLTDQSYYETLAPGYNLTTSASKESIGITADKLFITYSLSDYSGSTKYVQDEVNLNSLAISRGTPGRVNSYYIPYDKFGALGVQYEDYGTSKNPPKAEFYSKDGVLLGSYDSARLSYAYKPETLSYYPTLAEGERYDGVTRMLSSVDMHLLNKDSASKERQIYKRSLSLNGFYPMVMRGDVFLAKALGVGTSYYEMFLNEPTYLISWYGGIVSAYSMSIVY